MIVERVAPKDATEALDLLWRFLALAESVFERCDDSNGSIDAVFETAVADLGNVATAAHADPERLADATFMAIGNNGYGQYDDLIAVLAPALGKAGLEGLRHRVEALAGEPVPRPPDGKRRVIGYGADGPIYQDDLAERSRQRVVHQALMDIADALGDVDAFIAQHDAETSKVPKVAAEIATRLTSAGRATEALAVLDAAVHRRQDDDDIADWLDFASGFEWEDARIRCLDALGRAGEAQGMRWGCFERALSVPHLRDYLKRLPDFDDVEAERRAFDHAMKVKNVHRALFFLIEWPALDRAAALIEARASELDGNFYEVLTPAADALSARYPLAAILALRAMIDFTLTKARSSRYRHAARHLLECGSLAGQITDFDRFETHEDYVSRLKKEHGRKNGFWGDIGR